MPLNAGVTSAVDQEKMRPLGDFGSVLRVSYTVGSVTGRTSVL